MSDINQKKDIMPCMKKMFYISLFLLCFFPAVKGQTANPDYDPELAKKLGADELGMKNYVLVILKTGTYNEQDSARRATLFAGHFKNINKLAVEGKLIVAGPLGKNSESYRGIFILDVSDFDEAAKLLNDDPTIKESVFEPLYFKWYGSAALPEYLPFEEKLRKTLP
jgi:uncharacterized protein